MHKKKTYSPDDLRRLSVLEEKLDYRFRDITLLATALTHSSWANFRDTYLGGHRGRRTQNGAMESHPTPMEARGCGPFCEKLLLTRHTQSCFSWGGRVSKAGPEQSRWEEALLRRPLVRVSPRARRQGSPTGCGRCN